MDTNYIVSRFPSNFMMLAINLRLRLLLILTWFPWLITCDQGVKNPPADEVGVNFVVFHVMYCGDAIDAETSIY
jgi:hypothetical protein